MSFEKRYDAIARDAAPARERLQALLALHWEHTLHEYPEWGTFTGRSGYDHLWTDSSLAATLRRRGELEWPARAIASIDRDALSDEGDLLSYDLFRRNADEALEGRRFPADLLPLTQLSGVHQSVAQMLAMMPARTAAQCEDYLARLAGVGPLVDQTIEVMAQGARLGVTPPRVPLREVPQQVRNQIQDDPLASPLVSTFPRLADGDPAPWRARAARVYADVVRPAYARLLAFVEEEYLPACRDTVGLLALPDGADWYAFAARQSTTTRLTPQEIHEIGLSEVHRIRGLMDAVLEEVGYGGRFAEFGRHLATDDRFYYASAEDLLVGYRDICKRADAELVKHFGQLPRLPYGVVPVPAYAEKSQTTAYYEPGSLAGGRAGNFFANTYDLRARPKWEMEALALHEAVPGHHLQIALAQELPDMPEFRKNAFYTAYVEGWGLYAESLGSEMGFYRDPYARYGQLTYEMWRAIRLVVDTGLHALGWSREQAIAFFEEQSSKAGHDIVVEVDRYIVWPGQALAYKIGELTIRRLRTRAQETMGARFDVRAFHDQVLGAGALPLDVLERRLLAWMTTTTTST
jgi:uncharacterized protein (DUF885 family)